MLSLGHLAQTVLRTQAELLKSLEASYGEDGAIELLESAEPTEALQALEEEVLRAEWFEPLSAASEEEATAQGASAYAELEQFARDLGLQERLEFHLWAFPGYRLLVESALPLTSTLRARDAKLDPPAEVMRLLQRFFEEWLRSLPMAPDQHLSWQKRLHAEWLKLRSQLHKKLGLPLFTRLDGPKAAE